MINKREAIMFLVIVLIFTLLTFYVVNRVNEIDNSIERCKEAGYDGVRFTNNPFSTEVECSNYSKEYKIANKKENSNAK